MRLKFAPALCCVLAVGCESAAASDHYANGRASRDERILVLSATYGKVRSAGAKSGAPGIDVVRVRAGSWS
jgi:hypothetical protein